MMSAGEAAAASPAIDTLEARCRELAGRAGIDPDGRDGGGMLGWVRFLEQARAELKAEAEPEQTAKPTEVMSLRELQFSLVPALAELGSQLLKRALPLAYGPKGLATEGAQVEGTFTTSDGELVAVAMRVIPCQCDECAAKRAARG